MQRTIDRNVSVERNDAPVHPFERYRTQIVSSASELPPPPAPDGLVVSGYSLIRYWLVRLKRGHQVDLDAALGFDEADESYLPSLWDGHPVRATGMRRFGPMPPRLATALGSTRSEPSLDGGFVWLDERHVLVALPVVIGCRDDYCVPAIRRSEPATISDVLHDMTVFDDLVDEVLTPAIHGALERGRFLGEGVIEQITPVRDAAAVELWDLRGSPSRSDDHTFDGAVETRTFAWELSALLSYAVFHVSRLGRWRDQRVEQVLHEICHGYTFVHDHMALANATCCLEVCNVPADFRDRVHRRIVDWGYDSSAIFVWGLEVLRGAVAHDVVAEYEGRLAAMLPLSTLPVVTHQAFVHDLVLDLALHDRLERLPRALREGRNRALSEDVAAFRDVARDLGAMEAAMDKAEVYGRALAQVGEDRRATRTTVLLATLAAALAAVGIPSLVEVYDTWIRQGYLSEVILATAAVVATLGGAAVLSRDVVGRSGRGTGGVEATAKPLYEAASERVNGVQTGTDSAPTMSDYGRQR
jgi:hypothetical protein